MKLTEEQIAKKRKELEILENELKKEQEEKEKKKETIGFFDKKVEKDFYLIEPCNVMAMGKIQNFEENDKPLHLIIDFIRDNSNLRILKDMKDEGIFEVWKGKEKWGKYSMNFYNQALQTAKGWRNENLDFYIAESKDSPLLMSCEDLGFVLAPRIEGED